MLNIHLIVALAYKLAKQNVFHKNYPPFSEKKLFINLLFIYFFFFHQQEFFFFHQQHAKPRVSSQANENVWFIFA